MKKEWVDEYGLPAKYKLKQQSDAARTAGNYVTAAILECKILIKRTSEKAKRLLTKTDEQDGAREREGHDIAMHHTLNNIMAYSQRARDDETGYVSKAKKKIFKKKPKYNDTIPAYVS